MKPTSLKVKLLFPSCLVLLRNHSKTWVSTSDIPKKGFSITANCVDPDDSHNPPIAIFRNVLFWSVNKDVLPNTNDPIITPRELSLISFPLSFLGRRLSNRKGITLLKFGGINIKVTIN